MQFDWFESGAGRPLPPGLREFFNKFGGKDFGGLSMLPLSESRRLLENWPRYGFSSDRGYVPIAEDQNGDLFCVACDNDECAGQVFLLAWAGEDEFRFHNLESFVTAMSRRT